MNNSSEKSIWNLFIEGDLNAFSSLFKQFYPILYAYGLKISGNTIITEDCLQNFFVYLHDHRTTISEIEHVKSYLFISFRRALFKALKKERIFSAIENIEDKMEFDFSIEEIKIEQETTKLKAELLLKLLNTLSSREKEVVFLKYYSNLKITEIAEVMNITYQSVLNTLQKAFLKLRAKSENEALKEIFLN